MGGAREREGEEAGGGESPATGLADFEFEKEVARHFAGWSAAGDRIAVGSTGTKGKAAISLTGGRRGVAWRGWCRAWLETTPRGNSVGVWRGMCVPNVSGIGMRSSR